MSLSYDGINLISCSNVRYKVFLHARALLPTGWRDQLNMCQAEEEAKANTPPVSCSSRSLVMRSWTLAKLDRNRVWPFRLQRLQLLNTHSKPEQRLKWNYYLLAK